ncbi:MAG: hypothetical protein RMK52_04370 [Chitinophagales bacterium]|nr:hypothetical protein [Chitinophagales bacterium]MDW8393462.1 hypothetical protein [Chitinophagales bacterium]
MVKIKEAIQRLFQLFRTMKRNQFIVLAVAVLLVASLTSCGTTNKMGCPGQISQEHVQQDNRS